MRGVLFKPDMIQAIIEGRKTQTRRLGGLKEINQEPDAWVHLRGSSPPGKFHFHNQIEDSYVTIKPPYGIGETVYIKEAWQPMTHNKDTAIIMYKDGEWVEVKCSEEQFNKAYYQSKLNAYSWHSPMMMPEWAARYFLMITVRVERLQEITSYDFEREGCPEVIHRSYKDEEDYLTQRARQWFIELWNSINKKKWESNPFVWVYTFKQIRRR
jgi:hypothetical protein